MDETRAFMVEDLLAESRWLARLAPHLVREESDRDDLTQEVWVAATEKPPSHTANLRGWLSRVLSNRARTHARAEGRRRQREASSDWRQPPATPEEATARLELQRHLAAAIASLPEAQRHVVYLRYVEDREPIEIARLLAEPPGTVRWRLKEALTRLRADLDRRQGDRRTWLRVLVPLCGPIRNHPSEPRPRWLLGVASISLVAAIAWIPVRGQLKTVRSQPALGPAERAHPPEFVGLARDLAGRGSCPMVEPLRARLAELRRSADPWRDLRDVFGAADPNPALESAVSRLLAAPLESVASGCEHSLSCRGTTCQLVVLVPTGVTPQRCLPDAQAKIADHLASETSSGMDSGTPFYDPLKAASYTRFNVMYRFVRQDGAAVARAQRAAIPRMGYDFGRPRLLVDVSWPENCRRAWMQLQRELDSLEQHIEDVAPEQAFAASAPNPALTARVVAWMRHKLDRPTAELPFGVECRAQVCALLPGAADDPLAVRWQCREEHGGVPAPCFPAPDGGGWYRRLEQEVKPFGRLRLSVGREAAAAPAYLVARYRDGDRRESPLAAYLAFMNSFDWVGAVIDCGRQFPTHGSLRTKLEIPLTSGDESPPNQVAIHVAGELGGTPLATCVAKAFGDAAERFTVPPTSDEFANYSDLSFPFDPAALQTRLGHMRDLLEAQVHDPGF
jgi:RNA polymerase sigma factor (sigma-70 family)